MPEIPSWPRWCGRGSRSPPCPSRGELESFGPRFRTCVDSASSLAVASSVLFSSSAALPFGLVPSRGRPPAPGRRVRSGGNPASCGRGRRSAPPAWPPPPWRGAAPPRRWRTAPGEPPGAARPEKLGMASAADRPSPGNVRPGWMGCVEFINSSMMVLVLVMFRSNQEVG